MDCLQCGSPIKSYVRADRKYCSPPCMKAAAKLRWKKTDPELPTNTSTGTIGAISELIVCADLLAHGYEVFRAVSPSSSCDLIAFKGSSILRIEVRTGHILANEKLSISVFKRDAGRSDIIAVAVNQTGVFYKNTETLEDVLL